MSKAKGYECTARINAFQKLFGNDTVDIHFVIYKNEEIVKRIPAHRILLSAVSPVFEVMFNDMWSEQFEVKVVDVSASSLKEFLKLFYEDIIPFNRCQDLQSFKFGCDLT